MECAMTTQGDDDMIAGKGCKAVGSFTQAVDSLAFPAEVHRLLIFQGSRDSRISHGLIPIEVQDGGQGKHALQTALGDEADSGTRV